MSKKGFSLAEVLITLTIIAIISAITFPLINKFKPDANKMMYLKVYDSVVESVGDAVNMPKVYSSSDGNDTNVLADFSRVTLPDGTTVGGDNAKFCQVLYHSMNAVGGENCQAIADSVTNYYYNTYNDATSFNNPSFTTSNGVQFLVVTSRSTSDYRSDIYFDVNGNKEPNCMYNVSSCKNPDRFRLMVNASGQVKPADPVGESYLNDRMSVKMKRFDSNNSSNYSSFDNFGNGNFANYF